MSNDYFFMTGELTQLNLTLTNPYSSESISIDDEYYLNNGSYDGGVGTDTLFMSDIGDALFVVNSVGTQVLMNMERVFAGDGGDVIVLADKKIVLNDMIVNGGEGDDIIWANKGNDTIDGRGGEDLLDGGPGNDTINGGDGNDTLRGGSGNDFLRGDAGDDQLYGDAGNDQMNGGFGNDFMAGGEGNDVYSYAVGFGSDTIFDTAGTDSIAMGTMSLGNLAFARDGLNVVIDVGGGETITIVDQLLSGGAFAIESLTFNNGDVFFLNSLNFGPESVDDGFAGAEDGVLAGNVLENDSDFEGDVLSVQPATITTAAGGTVELLSDGTFTYVPAENYFGADSFEYIVTDGVNTDTGSVTLSVSAVNDAPEAVDGSAVLAEDGTFDGAVSGTDIDGDVLSFTLVTGPAYGELILNADGTFTYTPNENYNGTDSFEFAVSDGELSASGSFALTVEAVNDAPEAADGSAVLAEDGTVGGAVSGTDIDGDVLSYSLVTGPAHGELILNADGTFTYTPNENFNGTDSFEFAVDDGDLSASGSFDLTVEAVNDAPEAVADSFSGAMNTPLAGNVLANDSDAEGDQLTVLPQTIVTAAGGTVELLANGSFTYTPSAFFDGTDSFTYTVTDGALESSAVATLEVVAPEGEEITGTEGQDTLVGTAGDDVLTGLDGKDTIEGGTRNDMIDGGDGKDLLIGGQGNDTILGGEGKDVLFGGDAVVLEHHFATDVAFPTLIERKQVQAQDTFGIAQGDLSVEFATTATITFLETGAGYNNTLGFYSIRADGTIQHTEIAFANVKDYRPGTEYTVNLPGAPDTDFGFFIIADGERANNDYRKLDLDPENIDFIYKWGTAEERLAKITDDAEDISLVYDDGHTAKELAGSIYHTSLRGGDTNLNPDGATHVVSGTTGDEGTLRVGFEDLRNLGDADFNDVVFDLRVADQVVAGGEPLYDDPILGPVYGPDDDVLYGGGANDVLYGGHGDDVLFGGEGADELWGGEGADLFVIDSLDGSGDLLKDFDLSEGDSINIADVLAGFDPLVDALDNFVRLVADADGGAELRINADGVGGDFKVAAVIEGGADLTMTNLLEQGALIADQSLIL